MYVCSYTVRRPPPAPWEPTNRLDTKALGMISFITVHMGIQVDKAGLHQRLWREKEVDEMAMNGNGILIDSVYACA